ncbi:uncharacterized protein [Miscanthus floridulus]|uniref:uncharacterized protein n=1 Tax=Miscanthus floridulus TaxID=154761 RepID=UPI0034579023
MGLHYEHHPALIVVPDFEQRTISTSTNGAPDALDMEPSAGDNLISVITVFCAFTVSICKELWDALEAKFRVSDVGSELYLMEQLYDCKMVENRSVVEQAHEIQTLAKELERFPCLLPDNFVAGDIIAKLPPSWRDFATSLKHKSQEFSVAKLIRSLDVEERARAKDNREKGVESSAANMV